MLPLICLCVGVVGGGEVFVGGGVWLWWCVQGLWLAS